MALKNMNIDDLCINTIRTLSMDAVEKASSGHPGTPMALAPLSYLLWTKVMRHNPKNTNWFNRDRFILSCGHASMLLYSSLFLAGYDISIEDIINFRQWDSKTPGHPEYRVTPGIEMTTGPLGQGFASGVGMAMAEAHMAAVYNRKGLNIVDHYTYAICSDGDMQEGISHEAASLAGHLGLGKLIYFYDDNRITIEGNTSLAYSDDIENRFRGYHWHVQRVKDINDLHALENAIHAAQKEKGKPSLIIVRSDIGYGAPNKQNKCEAHGEPLGAEEIRLAKKNYGWPENEHFLVLEKVLKHSRKAVVRGEKNEKQWNKQFDEYRKKYPDYARMFEIALKGELPEGWDESLPDFSSKGAMIATRSASGKVIQSVSSRIPWLIGGSADLGPSNKSVMEGKGDFANTSYASRNIHWGIREHAMCACSTGIALHGGVRPYASTFFIFSDYARPAIRLASLMKIPVIYVMTHDSIGLGEDGPTHQPIEHIASFRAMPGIVLIRPADANETVEAWKFALQYKNGPVMLVLTRQNLPVILQGGRIASAKDLSKGGYILSKEKNSCPHAILIASGSEVHIALEAQQKLEADGIDARVVSMPSTHLFSAQPKSYRDKVLPPSVKARISIEAASTFGWREWVGDEGEIIGIETFGASAPYKLLYSKYGLTVENVVEKVKKLLK
ncbi:MAG: transketolase [Candidatus Schekmanbacteria bacterium]|nr:transketolase [Candidatus Schekmanbacteria bacterium]